MNQLIKLAMLITSITLFVGCSDDEQSEEPVSVDSEESAMQMEEQTSDELTMLPEEPMPSNVPANLPEASPPSAGDMQAGMGMGMGEGEGATENATPAGMTGGGDGVGGTLANGSSHFVRCNVLTIRNGPGKEHKTEGYLIFNAEIKIQAQQGKWVKFADNKWISSNYLTNAMNAKPSLPAH